MSAFEIRPRSATEIIDASFELLRRDYLSLITVAAVVQLPLIALQIFLDLDISTPAKILANLKAIGLLAVLGAIAMSLADAAIICMVSDTYLGRKASVGRALARMLERGISLVVSGLIRTILSYIAMFAFIVPGLYVYFRWTALPAVIVLEEKGPFESMDRSWSLAEGRGWKIVGTMLLGWIIYFAVAFVFNYGVQWLGTLVPGLARPSVIMAIQRLPVVFCYPIIGVITTLVYYDLRVRKEAFDLEMMASELGQPSAAPRAMA